MTTAYFTDSRTAAHTLPDHPENAGRLRAVNALFEESGILARLDACQPEPAAESDLLAVHTPDHLALLAEVAEKGRPIAYGGDTYIVPESYLAARLAAGAAMQAGDAVLSGAAKNALVAMRPPGHHALPDRPMGFCLLANVALAARHLQDAHGLERILIVDYDVHHGNGTEAIFYHDPGVYFASTHRAPFYPGTGQARDTGSGAGRGTTLNIPLPAGSGDAAYARVYEDLIWPAVIRFMPQIILVSAGFDCHWADPLGGMALTLTGYDRLTRELVRMADMLCDGKIVFVLEGGYNLDVVAHGMLNIAYALLGERTVSDPFPLPNQRPAAVLDDLVARLKMEHDL